MTAPVASCYVAESNTQIIILIHTQGGLNVLDTLLRIYRVQWKKFFYFFLFPTRLKIHTVERKSFLVLLLFMVHLRVQQTKLTISCIVNVTSGVTSLVRLCPIAADGP